MGNNANSSTVVSYDEIALLQHELKQLFSLRHNTSMSYTVSEAIALTQLAKAKGTSMGEISSMLDTVEENNAAMLEMLHG